MKSRYKQKMFCTNADVERAVKQECDAVIDRVYENVKQDVAARIVIVVVKDMRNIARTTNSCGSWSRTKKQCGDISTKRKCGCANTIERMIKRIYAVAVHHFFNVEPHLNR